MKKYLMIGLAALAFASCSKHDFETMSQEQIDKAKYNEVFVNQLLDGRSIANNQDWGFGTYTGTRAFTRGHNANANEWGATYKNVPDTLTAKQKLRVQKYFQYNKEPKGTSVNYKDFFVQDVYKGATDALGDGTNGYSTEMYNFNGTQEAGSAHMDKLTAGSENDHINNYNNAHCTINNNVWNGALIPQTHYDNGTPIDFNDRKIYHSDAIMLMVDSKSDCFGWHESQGDVQHNDQYVIISAATIDKWANDNKNIINDDLGEAIGTKFNRNFVAFDYEAKINLEDLYARTWPDNEIDYYADGIPYITNEMNKYSYTIVPANTEGAYPVKDRYVDGDQSKGNIWVKIGCADGYYSDWIVCIVEGLKRTTDDTVYDLRIIAEDLSAQGASDFDFNDVVLDIKYGSPAKILLVAAGGTLPLKIGSTNGEGGIEVHDAFGVGPKDMVNTGAGPEVDPVDITNDINMNIADVTAADGLRIEVFKNGTWQLLEAPKNEPACKLAVGTDFIVLGERESIKDGYELFVDWATTTGFNSKWW